MKYRIKCSCCDDEPDIDISYKLFKFLEGHNYKIEIVRGGKVVQNWTEDSYK